MIHVFGAIVWVGGMLFLTAVAVPFARSLPPEARVATIAAIGRRGSSSLEKKVQVAEHLPAGARTFACRLRLSRSSPQRHPQMRVLPRRRAPELP